MKKETNGLLSAYIHFTKKVLPILARSGGRNWPVSEDHCFQRIILDHVCRGAWYEYLDRPAYKHLTNDQANRAVKLCVDIADGRIDLHALNQQSLIWRGKHRADKSYERLRRPRVNDCSPQCN